MTRRLLVVLTTAAGMLIAAPAASAYTTLPVWQCRGSATFASVAGNNRVEPIVANGNINTANGASPDRAQCVDSETGAGNTATQLGDLARLPRRGDRQGEHVDRARPRARDRSEDPAEGRVEDLSLLLGAGGPALGVGAANSDRGRRAACAGSLTPKFSGDSRVADITLGGTPIPLDRLVDELTKILNPLLGAVVEIKVDERISDADSLTINALHIKVLKGSTPLVDLVIGQAKVARRRPGLRSRQAERRLGHSARPDLRAGLDARRRAQPVRHPGRHERLQPRRDRHRQAVPGSERRPGHPGRRRAQALRQAARASASAAHRSSRSSARTRPTASPARTSPTGSSAAAATTARRRPRQRLHRGRHRRRQHLGRAWATTSCTAARARTTSTAVPARTTCTPAAVTTRSTPPSAGTVRSVAPVATSSTSRPRVPRPRRTAAPATTSPASTTTRSGRVKGCERIAVFSGNEK